MDLDRECKFGNQPNSDGFWECRKCGWILSVKTKLSPLRVCGKLAESPIRDCDGPPPNDDELLELAHKLDSTTTLSKAKAFTTALIRWSAAGFPTRPDEEVANLYWEHCRNCNWHIDNTCGYCGCPVSPKKGNLITRNKLKMATEHCPVYPNNF